MTEKVTNISNNVSVETLIQEANNELNELRFKTAKTRIKSKLAEINAAEVVLANLKHEFDDLKAEIEAGLI